MERKRAKKALKLKGAVAATSSQVLDAGNNLCPLHNCRDSVQGVSDLMYSPNSHFLAAATYDTWIDVYK